MSRIRYPSAQRRMETEKETLLLINHSTIFSQSVTYDNLKEPEKIKQILHTLETHISKKIQSKLPNHAIVSSE